MTTEKQRTANSGFKKLAVQWLKEVQFSNQTFVLVDNFVLRNRQLLKPAKRQAVKKPPFLIIPQIIHTSKRHYSPPTASYFLGRKLSLLFNKVFIKPKIVRYTDQTSFCFVR